MRYCCYILLIIFLGVVSSGGVSGQYAGGAGDGHEMSGIVQSRLNGSQPNTVPMYVGGKGDGYTFGRGGGSLAGGDLTALYAGSTGDGYDQGGFAGALDGQNMLGLYAGGDGDGYVTGTFSGVLDGTAMVGLYSGGDGDGFARDQFAGVLDGASMQALFTGSDGDGFSSDGFAGALDGPSITMLYGGGDGDGFVKAAHNAALSGDDLSMLYGGGPDDGYDRVQSQIIIQSADCSIVINKQDDGFGSLRYAVNCAQPGDTVTFTPGLAGDTITLTSGMINLDEDIAILANADDQISVRDAVGSGNFAVVPGVQAIISGLKIIVGQNAFAPGINNEGYLTIIDLTIINPNASTSILNASTPTTTAQLTVRGTCYLIE